jgi:hypothetical protein
MEKDKGYYSLGPQRSPLPQLLAMPRPTPLAQPDGLLIAHGAWEHGQSAHGMWSPHRSASSAHDAVQGSTVRRSTIGDEANGTAIHTTPATRCYTHTSMATM